MKQQRWITLIFFASLLSVFSLGCSKQTPEPTKSSDAPAAEAQMDAMPQVDQEVPVAPNANIPTEDKKDSVPEVLNIPGWPQTDAEILKNTDISDFSKYALAIYLALGCSFENTPAETHENDAIFDPHNMEMCEKTKNDTLLKRLNEHKADINAYNAQGKTLLSTSLFRSGGDLQFQKETQVFDMLIQYGADITKPNADGSTILMITDFPTTASQYIAAGGDIHAKDKQGKTALEHQKEKLNLMKNGKTFENERFPYFHEEGSMGCLNESEMQAAKENKPQCITYADLMRSNVAKIIEWLETK